MFLKFFRLFNYKTVLLVLLPVLGFTACGQGDVKDAPGRQQPPPRVTVFQIQKTDMDVFRNYPAKIHGSKQVQVRARVQGILKEKRYSEGGFVSENDILFIIDPQPYQIALRKAEAALADARASFDHTKREWERHARLFEKNAVSQRERDQALTNFELARAHLAMSEAALDDDQRNLSYTQVRSPVAGVTGMENVSEGNLIEWGGLLTTITQKDPVHVRFSLPENDAATLRKARKAMKTAAAKENGFSAQVILPDGEPYAHMGTIDFTASTIDAATGTVSARAVFPNPDHILMPGGFVRIRILLHRLKNVAVIPEQAVGHSHSGSQVFVVNKDGKAMRRDVALGPVVEGKQVILAGLDDGEQVVVNGQVALQDGTPVLVKDPEQTREAS